MGDDRIIFVVVLASCLLGQTTRRKGINGLTSGRAQPYLQYSTNT